MISAPTVILDALGIVAFIGGSVAYLKSGTRKVNDAASVELIANLTKLRETDKEDFNKRLTVLENQRKEDTQSIARLEGQVQAYKDIPLQAISASMEKMAQVNASIANSNAQILDTLKSSALIAATDRDVLTAPANQIVQEQTVEHQVVKG